MYRPRSSIPYYSHPYGYAARAPPRAYHPAAPAPRKRSTFGGQLSIPMLGSASFNYSSGRPKAKPAAGVAKSRSLVSSVRSSAGRSVMTAPASIGTSTVRVQPTIQATPKGQLCFRNREVIAQLQAVGDSAFTTQSFVINPGLPIFPLLRNIARTFQRYNMRLKFTFETNMPSSSQGQTLIIVNRNVQEEIPQTYSDFSSYMGCVTSPVWSNVTCPGSGWIQQNDKWLYTRSGVLPAGTDSLMYDVCRVIVAFANVGTSTNGTVGTLFCDYEVCFDGPKVSDSIPSSTFTSTLGVYDPFVATYLPVGGAYLNGGAQGPWTMVNFRAGAGVAQYVPDLYPTSDPGGYSGIVISSSGNYKITTQFYYDNTDAPSGNYYPGSWQADGDNQVSTKTQAINQRNPSGGYGISQRINYVYVAADDSIITEAGEVLGSVFFKVNGGTNEPTQLTTGNAIQYIIIYVEQIDPSELQLLGVADINGAAVLTTAAAHEKFSHSGVKDRTFAHRKNRRLHFVPPCVS